MAFTLRPYQQQASDAGVRFFSTKGDWHGLEVLPTGSGKSLVVADIASRLDGDTLILQPSKEILQQNYDKMCSYGKECSIFSASMKSKDVGKITFATIQSVMNDLQAFDHFRNIIVDECHRVNPSGGQYVDFIKHSKRKVLGLTATPYILASTRTPVKGPDGKVVKNLYNEPEMQRGAILRFLTRMKPKVFKEVLYYCQVYDLLKQGYLAQVKYYDVTPAAFYDTRLQRNSTGMDYDTDSVQRSFMYVGMYSYLVSILRRIMRTDRKHILVFCHTLAEAEALTGAVPGCAFVSGETSLSERDRILQEFKAGKIRVVANVGVLTTGFDFPALDTVVMARPTLSLAMYYQIVGRLLRPFPGKEPWFVDLCGNIRHFGQVEHLWIDCPTQGEWLVKGYIQGIWTQLTNIFF